MSDKVEKQENKSTKLNRIRVGTGFVLSQLFFVWVFKFIFLLRRDKSNFKNVELFLRKSETAEANDEILDKKWQEEIKNANKENR